MKQIFIFFLLFLIGCQQPIVCVHHDCFTVDIADTPEERGTGLMLRESIDRNEGMLFTYPDKEIRLFWMKNTKIPLDILWIDDGMVVFVSDDTPPCTTQQCPVYGPNLSVQYILEVNAVHNFSIGHKVTFNGIG